MMGSKTLNQIVAERPFLDYADWWDVGSFFLKFMSNAIHSKWSALPGNTGDLETVNNHADEYIRVVFDKEIKPSLVTNFVNQDFNIPIQSGEFDALSYAFYRTAFELIEKHIDNYNRPLQQERRLFTKRVGKSFFTQVHTHLDLILPAGLDNAQDFAKLKANIQEVGALMKSQGYLREHFDFRFDLEEKHGGRLIRQKDSAFLANLKRDGVVYAVYEMGYPIIQPSAVYLFHTIGEAQHHSSRTIEELFARVGYEARETDDFDPIDYPSERVVELWEIRQ